MLPLPLCSLAIRASSFFLLAFCTVAGSTMICAVSIGIVQAAAGVAVGVGFRVGVRVVLVVVTILDAIIARMSLD